MTDLTYFTPDDDGTVTISAGEYRVGDPCYVVSDEHWMPLLDSSDFFRKPVGVTPDGTQVLAFGTKYGDGLYTGSDGFGYGVDAGLIGLVPIEYANARTDMSDDATSTVTFAHDVKASYEDGTITFGDLTIETGDTDEDDDDPYATDWDAEDETDDEDAETGDDSDQDSDETVGGAA